MQQGDQETSELVVYVARAIHTMNDSQPMATAVACRDGDIVEVGSLDTMQPWLNANPHRLDERFSDKVMMPGFIDPHLHPVMAAMLLPCVFITAMRWKLPDRTAPAVKTPEGYLDALRTAQASMTDPDEPLVTWGYHRIWHGDVSGTVLDQIGGKRPVVIWQRSFHEMIVNDAVLSWLELDREALATHPQVDLSTGRFYESGLLLLMSAMSTWLLSEERLGRGLEMACNAVQAGGHTTIGDMAFPLNDSTREWAALQCAIEMGERPFRVQLIPRGLPQDDALDDQGRHHVDAHLQHVRDYRSLRSPRIHVGNGVKLFTDGGFFAELMQLQAPGFIDGHEGEWLTAPEVFEAHARVYWNAGYRIHVHCTGDLGVALALDVLERLQFERPRFNHRFTIEHLGVSTPEQIRRMKDLGACASVNAYYLYELGEAYHVNSIGHERASQMARLGTLTREGVTTALHTDFTMAPALPLNSAWVAVNRVGESGAVLCKQERLSVHQAMRAITIDAAYVLGMEESIGSIRAGKKADFTVLDDDPYTVDPMKLRDIPVHATVFEGAVAEQ